MIPDFPVFIKRKKAPGALAPRGAPGLVAAAAAVVVVPAAAVIVSAAVAAAKQQDQNDDPPDVAAEARVVTTHSISLRKIFFELHRSIHAIPAGKKCARASTFPFGERSFP